MALAVHELPHVSGEGGRAGTDLILLNKTVDAVPLDFKIDINSLFSGYLQSSDVGLEVGDLFTLVDSGGNPAFPAVSGALITNLNVPQGSDAIEGAVKLSGSLLGTEGVNEGFAATPKAVADLNALVFRKSGGEFTGAITLPNDTFIKLKSFTGAALDIFKINVSNELIIGNIGISPLNTKMYTDGAIQILNQSGTLRFAFNEDGTSSGVESVDVHAPAITDIVDGSVLSHLSALNTIKVSKAGGTMTGQLDFGNSVPIKLGASDEVEHIFNSDYHIILSSGTDLLIKDGDDSDTTRFIFTASTGAFIATGNITAFSDERVKKNIKPIIGALAKVREIGGWFYDRTDIDVKRQMGVMAQKVEEHFPEAVETCNSTGRKSVAYGNLAAAAGFAAINELAGIVEYQDKELAQLSLAFDEQADELAALTAMVKQLNSGG